MEKEYIIYDGLEQGTQEWLQLRSDKMTASNATAIGNCGAGLKTLVDKIVLQIVKPQIIEDKWLGTDVDRGNRLEPIARTKYEFEKGIESVEVGFIQLNKYVGMSPDGITFSPDMKRIIGGQEIKARNDANHLKLLETDKVESNTLWQIQMSLKITGADWWDYISYNPNFKQSLYVQRILPIEKYQLGLEKGFKMGQELIESKLKLDVIKAELA